VAARPIWKGAISFGLVHVPVTLYSMEKRVDLHFRLLDSRTKSTIRYERVNEVTGEEVPWDKIVKGYELSKDNFVLLDEEDFKKAAVEATQMIEIEDFVDASSVSYEYMEKPYVLVPQKKAEKGYVLLRDILSEKKRIGIARVVIRTREYLAAVAPYDNALVLVLMRFAQELRPLSEFSLPEGEPASYKISSKEIELASDLIDSQTSAWNPEQYKDEYRDKLLDWIEKKAESDGTINLESPDEEDDGSEVASNVVDLVELLRKSVKGAGAKPTKKEPASKAKPKVKKSG